MKVVEVSLSGAALERLQSKFFLLVKQSGGCWDWLGPKHSSGAGRYLWGARDGGNDKYILAHRLAFYLYTGELPAYMRNLCGSKSCCRPIHWWIKPDARWKPKPRKAVRGRVRELSVEDIQRIRLLATLSNNEEQIGKEFGLTRRQVADIALGNVRPEAGGRIRPSRHKGIRHHHQQFEQMIEDLRPDEPVPEPLIIPQPETLPESSQRVTGCPVPSGRPFPSRSYGQPYRRRVPRSGRF